jgi:hypothetical protein
MMRVRTIRKHLNSFPPQPVKNYGRVYEVSDREGANLIHAGLVEAVEDDEG